MVLLFVIFAIYIDTYQIIQNVFIKYVVFLFLKHFI